MVVKTNQAATLKTVLFLFLFSISGLTFAQDSYLEKEEEQKVTYFKNPTPHNIVLVNEDNLSKSDKPKNIILFIGDGMGTSHVFAALTANRGALNLENFKQIGFSKTQSQNDFVTDSGAGGTAISTGKKTYNKAIATDSDSLPIKTILEWAEEKGLSTGLIATACITHATPASFVSHNKYRYNYEEIAEDFLKTEVDLIIGGGRNHFILRKDSVDLLKKFEEKGYQVGYTVQDEIVKENVICLTDTMHPPVAKERGEYLSIATEKAVNHLSKNENGFFLMVEASQIDWGGHDNDAEYIIRETLDLDKAIGEALKFAEKDGETLIIVTADHETSGMSIVDGDFKTGEVTCNFASDDHTAVMVPVYAIGPGAELFGGIYQNTAIFDKMMKLLGL